MHARCCDPASSYPRIQRLIPFPLDGSTHDFKIVACGIHLLQRNEFQAGAVDAVAQAALRARTVWKHMPQVRSAARLRTSTRRMLWLQSACSVTASAAMGRVKLGQPQPESNLFGELNKELAADDIHINAGRKQVVVCMAEGVFGAALLGDAVLLGG